MTVSSTTKRNSYTGDGSTTTFAYSFKIFDEDDITVILRTTATGTETVQTKTTHYSVTGVGSTSGGNVVFGSAPTSAQTVVLLRQTAQTQATDYTPNDPFPAASHEDALDKLTLVAQDQQDELDRAIKLSRANTMTSTEFTVTATDRANKVLGFDGNGELTVAQELGSFRGDFAASTSYSARDIIRDTSTGNIFIVNEAHTSSGSEPLTSNANSAKYTLLIESATLGVVAGTVTASRGVIVDANKDITGFRNVTLTGELDAATLDISGDADIDGTLEADAITINGVTLAETISDTVGAMVGSNTETGISVSYEDGDNTLDFVLGTAQTTIESIKNTSLVVGRDDDNLIKFSTDNQIIFEVSGGDNVIFKASGEIEATSLDISGDADIDGTLEADAMTLNGTAITSTATLDTGISNNNVPKFTSGVADNDFLRVDGTAIEGRSASEVLSDISAAPAAGDSNIVTTGALDSGSITSGFGAIDNGASAITTTGVITGGTVEATADTSSGDNAAIGYTAAEGLILTGQGSTNDVTIKNDADADVLEIPTGTTDVTVVGNITGGGTVSGAHALSHRNMVNNGAMQIAQRATSATGLGTANGYFAVDRFNVSLGATSAGRFTISQSTVTDLEGFPNALKLDCTTADTSIAAGEALVIQQNLEGQNVQRLTATSTSTNAFTLSFYAKSNASRAIASEIVFVNGTNRQISKLHTIGTSWARYTMTVPAASSTQIDDDNSHELSVNFWVHAGSTYTGGTINDDALDSITNANRAPGIGSLFASTDNTLEITGLQLELGSVTPFEHRSFGDELAACQRYYHQLQKSSEGGEIIIAGATSGGTNFNAHMFMPMRAAPTVTFPTSASVRQGGSTFNVSSWSASAHHPNGTFNLNASMASSATANTASFAYSFQNDISFDAEL